MDFGPKGDFLPTKFHAKLVLLQENLDRFSCNNGDWSSLRNESVQHEITAERGFTAQFAQVKIRDELAPEITSIHPKRILLLSGFLHPHSTVTAQVPGESAFTDTDPRSRWRQGILKVCHRKEGENCPFFYC